jgi:hypothetical protein
MQKIHIDEFKTLAGHAVMQGMFVQYTQPELDCSGPMEFVEVRLPYNPNNKHHPHDRESCTMKYQLFRWLKEHGFEVDEFGTTKDGMGYIVMARHIPSFGEEAEERHGSRDWSMPNTVKKKISKKRKK